MAAAAKRIPEGGTVALSFGDTPVDEYVTQIAADHLVHGWDLAAATGGDRRFDPEVVAAIAAWFADGRSSTAAPGRSGRRLTRPVTPRTT